jgi:thiamine-phosphate pyrophosphorylase
MERNSFLLAVITQPVVFEGETDILEGMLEAGLQKLHLRKPGASDLERAALLERLAPRWASRLVWHGSRERAVRYGVAQVHGSVEFADGQGRSGGGAFVGRVGADVRPGRRTAGEGMTADGGGAVGGTPAISTSVHSWAELKALPAGLAYAFISPLFDSISKPGYGANKGLLQLPDDVLPCMPVGLGGIGITTLGDMMRAGWKGAAVLGEIWEEPQQAVKRFERLKKIIDGYGTGE